MFTALDHAMMSRAIALAEKGRAITSPNPFVGCVMVNAGRIVGEGFTQKGGRPHAEAMALQAAGERARGATAYVTLEPCSERPNMRGPACANLLVEAGIREVIAAISDPNPHIDGAGFLRLNHAGIASRTGLMADAVEAQLKGFLSRVRRQRPWVTLKIAATLDGKTALNNGQSKWITGPAARRDVHRLRSEACAILTGIGTVKSDDPQLNVRDWPCERQPLRVVLDSAFEIGDAARILEGGRTLIATTVDKPERASAMAARGIETMVLPKDPVKGKVDLHALMRQLAERGINQLMVESGPKLNASLLMAGVADEVIAYEAPSLFGDAAAGMFALPELQSVDAKISLAVTDRRMVGADCRVTARIVAKGN
jgi:diaminohydroxyphosphoribosylaminopyrimidine deaminase/5-amino-6-(5-phosphoribosylamino)uracil reductase